MDNDNKEKIIEILFIYGGTETTLTLEGGDNSYAIVERTPEGIEVINVHIYTERVARRLATWLNRILNDSKGG